MSEIRSLSLTDYTVVDIETTNFNGEIRPVQVAALKVRESIVADEFSVDVNPECPIDDWIKENTSLTNEYLMNCHTIDEVIFDFIHFIGNDVLVGQNILSSDINPLKTYTETYLGHGILNDYVDTLQLARESNLPLKKESGYGLDSFSMEDIKMYFGFPSQPHIAINDCRDEQRFYEILKQIPKKSNQSFKRKQRKSDYSNPYRNQTDYKNAIEEVTAYDEEVANLVVAFSDFRPSYELYSNMLKLGFKKENEREQWKKDIQLLVVADENTNTGKVKKAIEKNVPIMTQIEFEEWINEKLDK